MFLLKNRHKVYLNTLYTIMLFSRSEAGSGIYHPSVAVYFRGCGIYHMKIARLHDNQATLLRNQYQNIHIHKMLLTTCRCFSRDKLQYEYDLSNILCFPSYPELKLQYVINAHPANCICIEFDPAGKYFATGSADALVSLWDTSELICVRTLSRLVASRHFLFINQKCTFYLSKRYLRGYPLVS